jgi:hypothetical protein
MVPNTAEQTSPTTNATSRNFRFFLTTLGSGSSGLGLAGIMMGSSYMDSLRVSFSQDFGFNYAK